MIRSIFFSKGCEWGWNMAGDRRKTRVSGNGVGWGIGECGTKSEKNGSYGCTTILLYFSYGSPMMRI